MHFDKSSAQTADDIEKAAKKRKRLVRNVVFGLILVGLLVGIGTYVLDIGDKPKKRNIRTVADISELSVVFINGEATLTWVDPPDALLHHIEILYWPGSRKPENPAPKPEIVAPKIEKHVISGLDNGREYTFTVQAVDKWKNKSAMTKSGTGKAFRQRSGNSIKGTPVAGQVTLSWTNLSEASYDFLEVSYYPNHETPIRVPRGVESKTLENLTNGLEHTFSVKAVDSQGNRKSLNEMGIFIPNYATSPESVFGRSSAGQVTLKWKESFGNEIRHLEVMYNPEGETPITIARSAEMATVTGLSDIIDYEFTVYAVNTAGYRRPLRNVKLSSSAIPIFNGRDAEQTVVRVQPVAGQVKFEWEDPEMANLNHIAITYEPGDSDVPVIVEKGTNTATVVGLSDSRMYRFVVYGVDMEYNNRVITGVKFSTPRLPVLRTKPVAGRVTLVWRSPEDPNLDYIRLTCTPGRETPMPIAKRMEAYTFTNLSDHEEYEFKITAVNTKGNVYGIARANVIVAKLPVLTGKPVDRTLSLAWADPADRMEHIEILYSSGPGNERTQPISRGIETHTFTNLADNTEYTFTIYGLDEAGNRHPVKSARIYDPRTAFLLTADSNPTFQGGNTNSLPWRSANNPSFGDSTVYTLSFGITATGADRWVAGGGEGKMAYSNDYGLNWTSVDDSTFGSFPINAICYGNGRWIAGGKSGRVAWSTNGTFWNAVKKTYFSSSQAINAIAFGNGNWIAGGSNGIIILSDDNGVTWRRIATNAFGKSAINTIVFHEGRWVAGGTAGKIAYSDDDGLTWTAVENSIFGKSDAVSVIVFDRNRWMAGGYGQSTAYSNDGVTWQPLPRPFQILCMGFNGSRWVVGGQGGRLAWSNDGGKTWVVDEQGRNLFGDDNWVQTIASGRSPSGKRRWLSGGQSGKIIYADEP
jgi:photosystem II stability/assembly factor-like uncharacterized protein